MQKRGKNKGIKASIVKLIVIMIVVICVLAIFAFNLSLFDIKNIEVEGNKILKKEEIIKQSGIKNKNLFRVSPKKISQRISSNPYIKSVKIEKNIPETVRLKVSERNKTFLLESGETYMLVDGEGVMLEDIGGKDAKLPLVKGFYVSSIEPGKNIFKEEENASLDIFINESKNIGILNNMEEINKNYQNEVNIKLKNKVSVDFGTLSDVKYKLGMLKKIMNDIEEKEIESGKIVMNRGDHPILIIDE